MDRIPDQFAEELAGHLRLLDAIAHGINRLLCGQPAPGEARFAEQLDEIDGFFAGTGGREFILHDRIALKLEQDAALMPHVVASWVERRLTARLHARADGLEQLATDATEYAMLSLRTAERILMLALAARAQAIAVQLDRRG